MRLLIVVLLLSVQAVFSIALAEGDETCPGAVITLGSTDSGNTSNNIDDYDPASGNSNAPDVVYRFTLTDPASVMVALESQYDAFLYVREVSCQAGTEIASDDDGYNGIDSAEVALCDLDVGSYYIFVDGYEQESGFYEIDVYQLDELDTCPGLFFDSFPFEKTSSTKCAADDYAGTCAGAGVPDVVFSTIPEVGGDYLITVNPESGVDVSFHVCTDCTDPTGTELACVDDGLGGATESGIVALQSLKEVFIIVEATTAGGSTGDFHISVDAVSVPANDTCEDADLDPYYQIAVPSELPYTDSASTISASADYTPEDVGCSGVADGKDIVYRLDLAQASTIDIIWDNDYDAVLYVSDSCSSAGTCYAYTDWPEEITRLSLLPGTYYLFVDGWSAGSMGSGDLTVRLSPSPLPGDSCVNPRVITTTFYSDTDDTSLYNNDDKGSCGGLGRDVVYQVELTQVSDVIIRMAPLYPRLTALLHVRGQCSFLSTELACEGGLDFQQITLTGLAAGDYYIFADGYADQDGPYNLLVQITTGSSTPTPTRTATRTPTRTPTGTPPTIPVDTPPTLLLTVLLLGGVLAWTLRRGGR